jgi:uncharacterized protein YndB with AHSA1/START domain
MSTTEQLEAIRRSVTVQAPLERVFDTFTDKVSTWWPLATHSYGGEEAQSAAFEPREGGRFYEVQKDGTEALWGTALAWEPPHRILLRWEIRGCAGTEVEVHFTEESDGVTRVDLEHRGWEQLGAEAAPSRENYGSGWALILSRFAGIAGT